MRSGRDAGRHRAFMQLAAVLIAALAAAASQWASDAPDGLSRVAADKGLDADEQKHPLGEGPLADYSIRGLDDHPFSKAVSGLVGVFLTFILATIALRLVRRSRGRGSDPG